MIIDKIYVINLNTPEKVIWEKLADLNIRPTNCFILKAENGWDIAEGRIQAYNKHKVADWWKLEDDPDQEFNSWWNRDLTPGERGCMLSHYYCYKDAYEKNLNTIMILEEDFYSMNKFPTDKDFQKVPSDWSQIYLSRNPLHPEKEEAVNNTVLRTHYSYNAHAYLLSKKGIKEIMESPIINNLIPTDEFLPAMHGVNDREDANKMFHNPNYRCYSFSDNYIGAASSVKGKTSLTENNIKPDWLDDFVVDAKREGKSFAPGYEEEWLVDANNITESKPKEMKQQSRTFQSIMPKRAKSKATTHSNSNDILNDKNWDEWSNKYVNPLLINKEYDLITDEPAPHVYTFPLFSKEFCSELIQLSEQFEWTTDRHKFYPTTDNLLSVLGMDRIYNRVINDYVRPYAIDRFQLEGKDWDHLTDESFIIKYPHDKQAHLSVHHDYSNITTLVNLNPGEFKGGGTYFPKYKCNVNPKEIGMATLHPGNITHKHGARPVTEGTRYVVVSFIKGASHK